MSKHLADHQAVCEGPRVKRFLALARPRREGWHRPHARPGAARLIHFLRIARGRTA